MSDVSGDWERRVSELWAAVDEHDDEEFVAQIDALVAELPAGSAIGLFERACALDSTGHSDLAAPLYRAALDGGLSGIRRRRAVIQMASSLRNLGDAEQALSLLSAELARDDDVLTGAVRGFLALALTDCGREREAVSVALSALAEYLPRYNASLGRYARALVDESESTGA